MDDTQLAQFVGCLAPEHLQPGHRVINEGDIGDKFYVVDSGTLDCSIRGSIVAEYGRGECFGELALLYDAPRAATIKVTTSSKECTVWSINVAHFKQIAVSMNCCASGFVVLVCWACRP